MKNSLKIIIISLLSVVLFFTILYCSAKVSTL